MAFLGQYGKALLGVAGVIDPLFSALSSSICNDQGEEATGEDAHKLALLVSLAGRTIHQ